MYVYKWTEPNIWTVGFYTPDGGWIPESDCDSPEKAAERVHYLNGGEIMSDEQLLPAQAGHDEAFRRRYRFGFGKPPDTRINVREFVQRLTDECDALETLAKESPELHDEIADIEAKMSLLTGRLRKFVEAIPEQEATE